MSCEKKNQIKDVNRENELLKIRENISEWESGSYEGDIDDLSLREEANAQENCALEPKKLGFHLPSNDKSKERALDTLSVDSYWVGEDEKDDEEARENKTDFK